MKDRGSIFHKLVAYLVGLLLMILAGSGRSDNNDIFDIASVPQASKLRDCTTALGGGYGLRIHQRANAKHLWIRFTEPCALRLKNLFVLLSLHKRMRGFLKYRKRALLSDPSRIIRQTQRRSGTINSTNQQYRLSVIQSHEK